MFDENGKEIDLDFVDAIGPLQNGAFEVWLQNERRLITKDPNALDIWLQHIRSKIFLRDDEYFYNATTK